MCFCETFIILVSYSKSVHCAIQQLWHVLTNNTSWVTFYDIFECKEVVSNVISIANIQSVFDVFDKTQCNCFVIISGLFFIALP